LYVSDQAIRYNGQTAILWKGSRKRCRWHAKCFIGGAAINFNDIPSSDWSNNMPEHSRGVIPADASDLLKRIQSFLSLQYLPSLRQLNVEVDGDVAIIGGKVKSFYERQVGIECCKRVAGVRKVLDHICVDPAHQRLPEGSKRIPASNLWNVVTSIPSVSSGKAE
jgi:hypothetical protein